MERVLIKPLEFPLGFLHDLKFRWGRCFVMPYDRANVKRFGERFLFDHIYRQCIDARPSLPKGMLPDMFCGFTDYSADAVCAYLHTRTPLLLMCVGDSEDDFEVAGFSFPAIWVGNPPLANNLSAERAMLYGYGMFRNYWGQPESEVLNMLAAAYFFHNFNLVALHGQRYPWNGLTAKFAARYGTRDVGTIPKFLLHNGKLVDCVLSTLLREDFEMYVRVTIQEVIDDGRRQGRRGQQGREQPESGDPAGTAV